MIADRVWMRLSLATLFSLVLGIAGCALGAAIDVTGFFRAWLCTFLFWLGVPFAGHAIVHLGSAAAIVLACEGIDQG